MNWYRYRNQYRKKFSALYLVSKVSEKSGIGPSLLGLFLSLLRSWLRMHIHFLKNLWQMKLVRHTKLLE